jgi:Ca-activated chloride channel family protein
LFEDSTTENRVLIMLTDGNDTGSTVPPVEAAKVAQAYGIRIYTIAIGDPATVGEEALDVETLERVAELTGGAYFQAIDRVQLLAAYNTIAELEPELYETSSFRPRHSIHHLPIAISVVLYMLYHLAAAFISGRREQHHA